MSKYQKGDCRNKGKPKDGVTQVRFLGKKQGYPEPAAGKNREMRRTDFHFRGIRKNTLGVPVGFNVKTWNQRCVEIAEEFKTSDASKGDAFKDENKKKRFSRPNDFAFKGTPGSKLLRKMFRLYGTREVLHAMSGAEREQRKHPGYARMGAYTKHGHKLCKPRAVTEK